MFLWIGVAILVFVGLWLLKAYAGLIVSLFTNPIGIILLIIAIVWWFNTGSPDTPTSAMVASTVDAVTTTTPRGFSDTASEIFWFIVMLPITIATFILQAIAWILNGIAYLIT